jgi:uncharacterized repeat protein (TIGR03847 family)
MNAPQHDFGTALAVDAEAVGLPGQRRFRLLVRARRENASIWMEKEQLAGIGDWLADVTKRLDRERPTDAPDVDPLPITGDFAVDFRAGQLALGYVEDRDLFSVQAFSAEADPENQAPTFRCLLSRGQSRVLTRKIERVIAGGRPLCPLCETPMDPEGHACPRSNGHQTARSTGA